VLRIEGPVLLGVSLLYAVNRGEWDLSSATSRTKPVDDRLSDGPAIGVAGFSLPWLRLGVIALTAYIAAVPMTYLPA
jgi:hypothetical protein